MSTWLTTDGTKIAVDTSLAPSSTELYYVYTSYELWCACTDSTYTYQSSNIEAEFCFQIKSALISVTTEQFSSTYTFYLGNHDHIYFPTFTTVPSSTGDSYSKVGLIVDGITLSSSGTEVSTLPWIDIYSEYFCLGYITLSEIGTHTFNVSLTF